MCKNSYETSQKVIINVQCSYFPSIKAWNEHKQFSMPLKSIIQSIHYPSIQCFSAVQIVFTLNGFLKVNLSYFTCFVYDAYILSSVVVYPDEKYGFPFNTRHVDLSRIILCLEVKELRSLYFHFFFFFFFFFFLVSLRIFMHIVLWNTIFNRSIWPR